MGKEDEEPLFGDEVPLVENSIERSVSLGNSTKRPNPIKSQVTRKMSRDILGSLDFRGDL